jgi:hypothetical protein
VKAKTALKQSIGAAKVGSVFIAILVVLAIMYPRRATLIPLAFFGLFWVGDLVNIWYIRRKAEKDPISGQADELRMAASKADVHEPIHVGDDVRWVSVTGAEWDAAQQRDAADERRR